MNLWRKLIKSYLNSLYTSMRNERRLAQRMAVEYDPQAVLLDCGCREGENTVAIAECIGARKTIGLDYNARVLQSVSQRGISPLRADLNHSIPLKDNSVDVVIASDVLEHLVNPYNFVGEAYRVLKPGGYIVLDTPNLASWHNIFALLLGIQPFSGPNITTMREVEIGIFQELRDFHLGRHIDCAEEELTRHIVVVAYVSLIRLFKQHGFQVELARGFGYYPFPPLLARFFQGLDPRHTHHVLIKARKPKPLEEDNSPR